MERDSRFTVIIPIDHSLTIGAPRWTINWSYMHFVWFWSRCMHTITICVLVCVSCKCLVINDDMLNGVWMSVWNHHLFRTTWQMLDARNRSRCALFYGTSQLVSLDRDDCAENAIYFVYFKRYMTQCKIQIYQSDINPSSGDAIAKPCYY